MHEWLSHFRRDCQRAIEIKRRYGEMKPQPKPFSHEINTNAHEWEYGFLEIAVDREDTQG